MHHHRLCFTLLAVAILAGCQSSPSSEEAAASSAEYPQEVVATTAADQQAVLSEAQAVDTYLQREASNAQHRVLHAPPPPPAPAPAAMKAMISAQGYAGSPPMAPPAWVNPANTEKYAERDDNPVHRTSEQPVSTFSVDVDTGSYSNVRRMLRDGVRPPADAVRAEEFINYFSYQHPAPADRSRPFRVTTELAPAPWNSKRQLLMIGIKGYDVPKATLPPANLVFLLDTSGSMESPDKLPLLKHTLAQLVPQLREQDRVSIVVYAGSAGLVLPPTPGDRHQDILGALERLQAGGSTNGGDGIRLAYAMARQTFIKDGVNRVILATDGDFNVGTVSQDALETLVADQRQSGIALTTLGFGQGNYNDALAERLADVGDGNHAYIDTLQEGRKVLVEEMQATLMTIARDVKIQIEFNPAVVAEYRLIGYENRLLNREDFANDKVDAGDIGAGHEVTALYEITPAGTGADRLPPLRYAEGKPEVRTAGDELAHLRLRYKRPGQDKSELIETSVLRSSLTSSPSASFRFASAVAAYADLLRGGTHVESWTWNDVAAAARATSGEDRYGLRREFVELVEQGRRLVAGENNNPVIAGE
ncbi:von Willebrand factor type A domain-containing protein [Pseudoxanthomonas sp. UTMC 1351]|uniref:vWA domain-containing protein n=1 Tax=Pseudoxanthomonas sp. UTMC 1351 TaxID=2695853 RepID=UPI0034CDE3FD